MTQRKENDTLYELEEKERLTEDIAYIRNIKNNIRNTSINRLEELRKEFIISNHISREEQVIINKVFKFLKDKA